MASSWEELLSQTLSSPFNVLLIAIGIVLLATLVLPQAYSSSKTDSVTEKDFPVSRRNSPQNSGYAYFLQHKDKDGQLKVNATVQIVVLGDIGRSPRMQYHALSIAQHGGKVELVGYTGSDIHPDILQHCLIKIIPVSQFPSWLQTNSKLLFPLLAPAKVLWQCLSLYFALAYECEPSKWMLVQNPPSIPTLLIARICCFLRNTRLVIDWHNFGYTILALRLGPTHPMVKISEWYEGFISRGANAHFAVTQAMAKVLKEKWRIDALPLHDRPPEIFKPLSPVARLETLTRLPGTATHGAAIQSSQCRLLVSSTSWTADEDFSILLDALVQYSEAVERNSRLPHLVSIITGRGPMRDHYLKKIQELTLAGKLQHVIVTTAWLTLEDYALLLGAADLGVSLHVSSSGVDLPMKVVDMFGTGLPVVGWSKFEAWSELVQEGRNGRGFGSAGELAQILQQLFADGGKVLSLLKKGALEECNRRWNDEWMPVAGTLFELQA